MTSIQPQMVQITCPSCNTAFQTPLLNVLDVTQQPELKQALLTGQINVATCPNCGFSTMLGTPLFYHDATKQLYLVYIPQELNLNPEQEEQLIGETSNILMQNLPQETPRGYLFTPRRMMSLATLIDTILEADGIPREVLEQQRRRVDLIGEFAQAMQDEATLTKMVEQHRDELTPEFFSTLDALLQAGVQQGESDGSVQALQMLRNKLAELSGYTGGEATSDPDIAEAIQRLSSAQEMELPHTIAEMRHAIDYNFFQVWTEQIEALEAQGNSAEAQRMTERRSQILELVEEMDKEAQAMFEAGTTLLREVLEADDTEAALRANAEKIDDAFMLVLSANAASAERAGQQQLVAQMEEISRLAVEIVQERLPPEERFINELMMAETAQESTRLLRTNAAKVTPEFVKKLNELADQQEQRGMKEQSTQIRRLAREAGAMLF